jgi:hypothetical protein
MITLEIDGRPYSDAAGGLRQLARQFETAPNRAAPRIAKDLDEYLHMIGAKLAQRHSASYPNASSDRLARRTGELVAALTDGIRVTSAESIGNISGEFQLPDYAGIQETGGVIAGRAGNYLAIPLPAALRADGTPIMARPRDWDNTFTAMSRRGNLILFRRTGRGRVVPLYVLKRQVAVPPRLGLVDTIETDMGYFVDKAMTSILNAILELA